MFEWKRLVLGAALLVGAAMAQPAQAAPMSVDSMNTAAAGVMSPVQARWVWVGHRHHRYYRPHHHYRHAYYHRRHWRHHRYWRPHHYRHHWRPYAHHRHYYRRW